MVSNGQEIQHSTKNGGQILKAVAEKRSIDVSRLDRRDNSVQRTQRRKKKLAGSELSIPCLPRNHGGKTSTSGVR